MTNETTLALPGLGPPSAASRDADVGPVDERAGPRHGAASVRARALKRYWSATLGYVALLAMSLLLVELGLLPRREVLIVTGYCVLGHVALYLLLRSRWAQRRSDPTCSYEHVLLGITTLLLGCALIPQDRLAAGQLFFLIVVFDLTRLTLRQMSAIAAATAVGLLVMSVAAWRTTHDRQALQRELMTLAMALAYVPPMIAVSRVVRRMMALQAKQRAALADALEQLQTLSVRDALTGASNRRHGEALLESAAVRHARHRAPVSLAMLDIDHFKHINDQHGHATGDAVLVALVRLIADMLAPGHTLVRWGGEEFLIVMPDTASSDAMASMQQLRRAVDAADWTACAPALRVDVSIGVCGLGSDSSTRRALELADAALYRAKREGRGRVVEHPI